MALLNLRMAGDDMLRKASRPVKEIDEKIIRLLDDMLHTMRHHEGMGLAAVQVGALKRIVIVDMAMED